MTFLFFFSKRTFARCESVRGAGNFLKTKRDCIVFFYYFENPFPGNDSTRDRQPRVIIIPPLEGRWTRLCVWRSPGAPAR